MPLPLVLIEVAPYSVASEYQSAMVVACSQVVSDGRCVLAGAQHPSDQATAIAIVSWDSSEHRVARIQVGLNRGPHGAWLTREMHFQVADAPIERWRAVGFAVGTLAEEQQMATSTQGPGVQSPSVSGSQTPRPAVEPQLSRGSALGPKRWIAVGALTGPGLEQGPWRFGAWLQGAHLLGSSPLFGVATASYAWRPTRQHVEVQWASVGAGAGARFFWPILHSEFRIQSELVLDHLRVAAHDPATGHDDSGGRWTPGVRVGLRAIGPTARPVALTIGVDGWTMTGATTVRVGGERFGSSPTVGICLVVGAELYLP